MIKSQDMSADKRRDTGKRQQRDGEGTARKTARKSGWSHSMKGGVKV